MKKFFYGMIALVSVSLFLVGCEKEVEVPKLDPNAAPYPDVIAETVGDLANYLDPEGDYSYTVVGTSGTLQLGADVTVPEGKTLYVYTGSLATNGGNSLIVQGKVVVGFAALSAAEAEPIVIDGGTVVVLGGGSLSLDAADAFVDTQGSPQPALGALTINGGTLTMATVAAKAGLEAAFARVTKGAFVATAVSGTDVMPSDLQNIGISETRRLTVVATVAEDADTTLTIPPGLTLTAADDDTLGHVTSLTVNGTLTADDATLAAATSLTVNGMLTSTSEAIDLPTTATITVGDNATLAVAGDTNTWENPTSLAIGKGATVALGGTDATLESLDSLTIGDHADVTLGTATTVKFADGGLTTFTIGQSSLTVGESSDGAIVNTNVAINKDATIKGITIAAGRTVTVTAATLTVDAAGITLTASGDPVAAKLVLVGGTTAGKLVTGDTTGTLGTSGDITLEASLTFTGDTDAAILKTTAIATAAGSAGVTAIVDSSATKFKSIQAGGAGVDLTLQAAATEQNTKISKLSALIATENT
jgi:hypothetical protein